MLDFTDAQEMQRMYPTTFEAPTQAELDAIKKGDIVKVNHRAERFWNKVTKVNGKFITAKVDNELICEQPFKCGDKILFEKRHVYAIWTSITEKKNSRKK